MKLIVGLGNPGIEYQFTPHNLGFLTIDQLADDLNVEVRNRNCRALTARSTIGEEPVVLAKPETFMNLSGVSVRELVEKLGIRPETDLIVIYDDLDLPIGKLRIRQKGSAGGHNGIKSIISTLGADEFLRIRVGIQPDRPTGNARDFVLSRVAKADRDLLVQAEEIAAKAVETLVADGIEKAMAAYNGIDLREEEKDS